MNYNVCNLCNFIFIQDDLASQENKRNGLSPKNSKESDGSKDGAAYTCLLKDELLWTEINNVQVLDAPELQDDFYLNLVDWSSQNELSVSLGSCVYLWSASTSQVTRLCDLSSDTNSITAVAWNQRVKTHPLSTNR
jgi:hypothetical protein